MRLRSLFIPASNQKGGSHRLLNFSLVIVLFFAIIGTFKDVSAHVGVNNNTAIRSGVSGYCLDDHDSNLKPGASVDVWPCNNTDAQVWTYSLGVIKNSNKLCLSTQDSRVAIGSKVVLDTCDLSAGQVWLKDKSGLYNPNSKLCLSVPQAESGQDLELAACSNLSQASVQFTSPMLTPDCSGYSSGERVACYAIDEWITWQSGKVSHASLLNSYTDGAPYEEWCADFVSYIYKEAGYPFTNGETNGWDENNANNIQFQGFTQQSSSYTPQPGDVGYFNYNGGHVEIVISGGKTPTFIYGNSATIDPTTGNGEMESNTITHDGNLGQITYYLAPDLTN